MARRGTDRMGMDCFQAKAPPPLCDRVPLEAEASYGVVY